MAKPNIVLILADDLGYSDLGCYGAELDTPNLDALAFDGVRLTNFYNTARCSPSRASLLTGVHPHQAGIGVLTGDDRPTGYAGDLAPQSVTLAEVLRDGGYRTGMVGKWHMSADVESPSPSWPTRRGFDHFVGTLSGCGSYFDPGTLTRGEENVEHEARDPEFFYTTMISDEAEQFIDSNAQAADPFFLYVAYTAPHWPLHALPRDIDHYHGRFDEGWDVLRERRLERQRMLGIATGDAELSPRDPANPMWDDTADKDWQARRMEVYAAQVTELDDGVGRIVDRLKAQGIYENTMIVFLSDNGASPEELPHQERFSFMERSDIFRKVTRDGSTVQLGNDSSIWPGTENTYSSYGRAWANVSNTPFRMYKKWAHEGGIAAPFLVHWPAGRLHEGSIMHEPLQLTNVAPTLLEAAGIEHPARRDNRTTLALEGTSFLPGLRGETFVGPRELYWEHAGNAAIRKGNWKLVRFFGHPWELYDIDQDPAELRNLAATHGDIVDDLAAAWQAWAQRVSVVPFEEIVADYEQRGLSIVEAEG